MSTARGDGQRQGVPGRELLPQLFTPRGLQLIWLLNQATQTPQTLRDLVPVLLDAASHQDAEFAQVRAAQVAQDFQIDDTEMERLQEIASQLHTRLDERVFSSQLPSEGLLEFDEAQFFADPFAQVHALVDQTAAGEVKQEFIDEVNRLPPRERQVVVELLQGLTRLPVDLVVLRSQFVAAINLIQPMFSDALVLVASAGTRRPVTPEERTSIEREVNVLLQRNPQSWRKALVAKIPANVLDRVIDWDQLGIYWRKRNLFSHRGGVADELFAGSRPEQLSVGAPVEIDLGEVLEAFDFAAATRLGSLLAVADLVIPGSGAQFASEHGHLALPYLRRERWWVAEGAARAALAFATTPETRALAQVNFWLARAGRLGHEAIQSEVEAWDPASIGPQFELARLVLLREDQAAIARTQALLATGKLSRADLLEWPLFARLRAAGLLDGLVEEANDREEDR